MKVCKLYRIISGSCCCHLTSVAQQGTNSSRSAQLYVRKQLWQSTRFIPMIRFRDSYSDIYCKSMIVPDVMKLLYLRVFLWAAVTGLVTMTFNQFLFVLCQGLRKFPWSFPVLLKRQKRSRQRLCVRSPFAHGHHDLISSSESKQRFSQIFIIDKSWVQFQGLCEVCMRSTCLCGSKTRS